MIFIYNIIKNPHNNKSVQYLKKIDELRKYLTRVFEF